MKPEVGPDYKDEVELAIDSLNPAIVDVVRIVDAGFGSFMEVAYEMNYEEGMDILEILDIRDKLQHRDKIRREAVTK